LKEKFQEMESEFSGIKDDLQGRKSEEEIRSLVEEVADAKIQELKESESDSNIDSQEIKDQVLAEVKEAFAEQLESLKKEQSRLAEEMENALKYWSKLQDKLDSLNNRVGEMQETQPDAGLVQKLENLPQEFVSGQDLQEMESRLREYIQKQVPAAAAKVIREEIAALSKES
jgi:predicted nuclease with TOPRIM domain